MLIYPERTQGTRGSLQHTSVSREQCSYWEQQTLVSLKKLVLGGEPAHLSYERCTCWLPWASSLSSYPCWLVGSEQQVNPGDSQRNLVLLRQPGCVVDRAGVWEQKKCSLPKHLCSSTSNDGRKEFMWVIFHTLKQNRTAMSRKEHRGIGDFNDLFPPNWGRDDCGFAN